MASDTDLTVRTSTRLFSEEVAIAAQGEQEDKTVYVFGNGRKFTDERTNPYEPVAE